MDISLRLGEAMTVRGWWMSKHRIIFAGESSPGIYSLVVEWTSVHNSAAFNLYFSDRQREFNALDGRITIVSVSNEEMRFRYVK